eukprot:scaffold114845_cov47-Prasinocladus_malaysianus.AAC.6
MLLSLTDIIHTLESSWLGCVIPDCPAALRLSAVHCAVLALVAAYTCIKGYYVLYRTFVRLYRLCSAGDECRTVRVTEAASPLRTPDAHQLQVSAEKKGLKC